MIVQMAKKFTHDMTTDDCHDDNNGVGGSEGGNLMSDMKTASPRMPSPLTAGITVLAFYLQVVFYGYTCG